MTNLLRPLKDRLPAFERNAWLFLASVIIGGVSFSIYQLYFNLYVLSLGMGKDFLGILSAMPSGVILILGLPLGVLADRMGRRTALLWGNAGATAAILILIATPSPPLMMTGAILLGLSQALFILSIAPFIMQVSNEATRTALFSANFGLQTLAGFFGSLLAGKLPGWFAAAFAWGAESPEAYRAAIAVSAAMTLLSSAPLWLIRNSAQTADRAANAHIGVGRLWGELTRPLILKLLAPSVFIGFGAAILIPYMNVFFKERFAIPDDWLGALFSLASVTMGVATLFGPLLASRLGKVRSVVFTQSASLVFMLAIGFWPNMFVAGLAFLIRGALMNMGDPLFRAFSMEQVPDGERATLNSAQTLVWEIGWTFGPAVSGFVQQRYGFAPLFIATCFFYALASALTYIFFRDSESKPLAAQTQTA
ncbi:MAG: MFS transporter [Chloroflexi bacterium]|nr:MFS transporter [Chloroflexota bacterium]